MHTRTPPTVATCKRIVITALLICMHTCPCLVHIYYNCLLGNIGRIIVTACAHLDRTCACFLYRLQGNNGRLVVTTLTERCVLALTTALHFNRVGAPTGAAGSGKTETVRDLGKTLVSVPNTLSQTRPCGPLHLRHHTFHNCSHG